MSEIRLLSIVLAFFAGVCIGNIGWVIPSLVERGGRTNTIGAIFLLFFAMISMAIALLAQTIKDDSPK